MNICFEMKLRIGLFNAFYQLVNFARQTFYFAWVFTIEVYKNVFVHCFYFERDKVCNYRILVISGFCYVIT